MKLLSFQNPYEIFQFLFTFIKNTVFEITTVQLLVQLPEKFLCIIWNLVTKKISKIRNVKFTFKN